jgi:hypothetical protein
VYCTVRRRLSARAAREGAIRIAVEITMFEYRELRFAGKRVGVACDVWRRSYEELPSMYNLTTSAIL